MRDLYEVLGVPKDASTLAIKTAYKHKAKELHPDKGGNDKQMAELSSAYHVLKDPKKRAYYDETGKIESVKQNEQSFFIQFFNSVMQAILQHSSLRDIKRDDLAAKFTDSAESAIKQINTHLKDFNSNLNKISEVEKRLKLDDETNSGLMQEYFLHQKKGVESKIAQAEAEKKKIADLLEIINRMTYERDENEGLDTSVLDEMLRKSRAQRINFNYEQ